MDGTNTFAVNFFVNPRAPFCTSTFTSTNLILAFIDVHTIEIQYLSLTYPMYVNASNNTLPYIHVSSYVIWKVHPLGFPGGLLSNVHIHGILNIFDKHSYILPIMFSKQVCNITLY